jgi:hypothetical protein
MEVQWIKGFASMLKELPKAKQIKMVKEMFDWFKVDSDFGGRVIDIMVTKEISSSMLQELLRIICKEIDFLKKLEFVARVYFNE